MGAADIADKIPGLILHVGGSNLEGCYGGNYKAFGTILLTAHVHDFSVYDQVLEKLDGMAVHTVNDVPQALIAAAQRRAKRAEARHQETAEGSRKRIEELEAQLSMANFDTQNYKRSLEAANKELEELREVVHYQDRALQQRS